MSALGYPPSKAAELPQPDPFHIGWRDVRTLRPDGSEHWEQVPLTLEDALHPQEGDKIMEGSLHDLIRAYLTAVLRMLLSADPSALVLSDTGVYWDIEELRHHCPDVAVILGVRERRADWSSFFVAEQGVRPRLIIEIVSPNTRENDVVTKFRQYAQARVPVYVIIDRESRDAPWVLRGYDLAGRRYLPKAADERGWLWLDAVGLWLGVKGDRVALYRDDTGEEVGDYTAVTLALQTEKARAEAAEARLRELEAELARRRNGTAHE